MKLRTLEQGVLPANTNFFKDFLSTKTHLTRLVFFIENRRVILLPNFYIAITAESRSRLPRRRKQRRMVHEHARLIQRDQCAEGVRERCAYKPAQFAVGLSNVFGLGPASRAEGTARRPQVPKRFDNGQQGL